MTTPPAPMALVGRKHPALARPAEDVTDVGDALRLAERMMVTVRRLRGHALAAPQVGRSLRMVVQPRAVVINPRIVELSGPVSSEEEGCLSLPGRWFAVPRHQKATLTGINPAGEEFTVEVSGVDARVWQHESDHLEGLLLLGRFEEIKGQSR